MHFYVQLILTHSFPNCLKITSLFHVTHMCIFFPPIVFHLILEFLLGVFVEMVIPGRQGTTFYSPAVTFPAPSVGAVGSRTRCVALKSAARAASPRLSVCMCSREKLHKVDTAAAAALRTTGAPSRLFKSPLTAI